MCKKQAVVIATAAGGGMNSRGKRWFFLMRSAVDCNRTAAACVYSRLHIECIVPYADYILGERK